MNKILVDSGPKSNKNELITTLASLTETLHLLDFLGWINAGAVTLENITANDLGKIKKLTIKYADLPMDFANACLVFLAEKLNIHTIATIDRDFDIYRIQGKKPFTTLIK